MIAFEITEDRIKKVEIEDICKLILKALGRENLKEENLEREKETQKETQVEEIEFHGECCTMSDLIDHLDGMFKERDIEIKKLFSIISEHQNTNLAMYKTMKATKDSFYRLNKEVNGLRAMVKQQSSLISKLKEKVNDSTACSDRPRSPKENASVNKENFTLKKKAGPLKNVNW